MTSAILPRVELDHESEAHRLRGDISLLLGCVEELETRLRLEGNVVIAARLRRAIDKGLRKKVSP